MKRQSLFLFLLSALLVATLGLSSMAAAATPGVTGGVEDNRMDKGNADWQKNRPVDESKRDHGYNVEDKAPAKVVKDDRMDRGNVDWQKDRPVDESKRDHGYNVEGAKNPAKSVEDDSMKGR